MPFLNRHGVHKFLQLFLLICLSGIQRGQFAVPATLQRPARSIYRHKGDPRQILQQQYRTAPSEILSEEADAEFEPRLQAYLPQSKHPKGIGTRLVRPQMFTSSPALIRARRYLLYRNLLI